MISAAGELYLRFIRLAHLGPGIDADRLVVVWSRGQIDDHRAFVRGLVPGLFTDSFESGDLSAWSAAVPLAGP